MKKKPRDAGLDFETLVYYVYEPGLQRAGDQLSCKHWSGAVPDVMGFSWCALFLQL